MEVDSEGDRDNGSEFLALRFKGRTNVSIFFADEEGNILDLTMCLRCVEDNKGVTFMSPGGS